MGGGAGSGGGGCGLRWSGGNEGDGGGGKGEGEGGGQGGDGGSLGGGGRGMCGSSGDGRVGGGPGGWGCEGGRPATRAPRTSVEGRTERARSFSLLGVVQSSCGQRGAERVAWWGAEGCVMARWGDRCGHAAGTALEHASGDVGPCQTQVARSGRARNLE